MIRIEKYLGISWVKQAGCEGGLDMGRKGYGGVPDSWCEPWMKGSASETGTPEGTGATVGEELGPVISILS